MACWVLQIPGPAAARDDKDTNPDTVMRSLMWGDSLSDEQLKVAAVEVGMSPERLRQLELKGRLEQLIERYKLPLEISGFGGGMYVDEEFRLYKSHTRRHGSAAFKFRILGARNPALATDNGLSFLSPSTRPKPITPIAAAMMRSIAPGLWRLKRSRSNRISRYCIRIWTVLRTNGRA